MAVKQLPKVPGHAPGQGVAALLKHVPSIVRSDVVDYDDDTSVNLFEVPGNVLIESLDINVVTAFDASGTSAAATGTITVPGDTGAVTVFDASTILFQATTTDVYLPSTNTGPIKTPSSGGFVILNQAPGTTTAGQVEVYMRYLPDVSKL